MGTGPGSARWNPGRRPRKQFINEGAPELIHGKKKPSKEGKKKGAGLKSRKVSVEAAPKKKSPTHRKGVSTRSIMTRTGIKIASDRKARRAAER